MARKKVEGASVVRPIITQSVEVTYYQVEVGNMGVVLPAEVDIETFSGLTLVVGRATAIESRALADKVAEMTSGQVVTVTEEYSSSRSYENGSEQRACVATLSLGEFTKRVKNG